MKYLVENKNKFKTNLLPLLPIITFFSVCLFLQTEYHINLYVLSYMLLLIPIYTYFTNDFKKYNLSVSFLMILWGIIMQVTALWGTIENIYDKNIFYYFLLFFILCYYFILVSDIKKVNKISSLKSTYLTKLIHKIKVEKDGNYYIDDEKSTLDARHKIPDDNIVLVTIEPLLLVTVVSIFIVIFGRISIILGLFSGKYFPKSDLLFIFPALALGNMFFLMGLASFLTYLKLDLSEEKDK